MDLLDSIHNPGLLKLALYCEGLRIADSARDELDRGREIMRTRAGLGSGLELVLPGGLWTNAPVVEDFCAESPFVLEHGPTSGFSIHHRNGERVAVSLAPEPAWYRATTRSGKAMRSVGTLQGTYLGIYPAGLCDFWREGGAERCKYCSVGLNLGLDDAPEKTVEDVVEVVCAARAESAITYVDFNTGHYRDQSFLDVLEPLIRAVKRETGLLVGVQTPPHPDLSRYDRLREIGVNRVSFCFELYDRERFAEVCPGKHRVYGMDRFLEAMDHCAALGRKPNLRQPWVTNGEIIAGLEAPKTTIAAIDRIVSVGAIPTVCVFRPLKGTIFADLDPPRTEAMVPVFRHLYEACMRAKLPIGLAPNIHVSLVMLPEECAWLSPARRSWRFRRQQWKLALMKRVFRLGFERELRRYSMRKLASETI